MSKGVPLIKPSEISHVLLRLSKCKLYNLSRERMLLLLDVRQFFSYFEGAFPSHFFNIRLLQVLIVVLLNVGFRGGGVLDVPPEVWGHLHEPFREGRTASLFGLRNSAVSSENTSLGKRRCYGYLK